MKRVILNLSIILSCFFAICAILGVMLIIAPGVDFYDIQFIGYNSDKMHYREVFANPTATIDEIVIETETAPIIISAEQTQSAVAEFNQNYLGFSQVKKKPSFEAKLFNRVLTIKVVSYNTFLLGINEEDYGVYVSVPTGFKGDVTVISKSSTVIYQGADSKIGNLKISTSGRVSLISGLMIDNLELNVKNKDVSLGDNVFVSGDVSFVSENADLAISQSVGGDISFKSEVGNLSFAECDNLVFESESGGLVTHNARRAKINGKAEVSALGDVFLDSVGKDATITTKSGDVSIGRSDGIYSGEYNIKTNAGDVRLYGKFASSSVNISTKRGDIHVENANVLSIGNERGFTKVENVTDITYTGKLGELIVGRVAGLAKVSTKSGDVKIGDESTGYCQNVEIVAEGSDVSVLNAIGTSYSIKTKKGDVTFVNSERNTNKPEVFVESVSGEVRAERITGKTTIYTNASVFAEIKDVDGKIDINSKNGDVRLYVYDSCYYSLKSLKKNIVSAPGLGTKTKSYSTEPTPADESNTIYVSTKWGEITVVEY